MSKCMAAHVMLALFVVFWYQPNLHITGKVNRLALDYHRAIDITLEIMSKYITRVNYEITIKPEQTTSAYFRWSSVYTP